MPETFDNEVFFSAKEAADLFGYTADYVSKLAREGKVVGKRIGRSWYVSETSVKRFFRDTEILEEVRLKTLSKNRTREYQSAKTSTLLAHVPSVTRSPYAVALSRLVAAAAGLSVFGLSFGFGYDIVRMHPLETIPREIAQLDDRLTTTLASFWDDRTLIAHELAHDARMVPQVLGNIYLDTGEDMLAFSNSALGAFSKTTSDANIAAVVGATQQGLTSAWYKNFGKKIIALFALPEFAYTPPPLVPQSITRVITSTPPQTSAPATVVRNITNAITYTGVSPEELDRRLAELQARIPSLIPFSGAPATSVVTTQTFSHSQKIDRLEGVTIVNPVITGGSISGTSGLSSATPPGGSDGLLQYNANGSFAGASVLYWNATTTRFGIATSSPLAELDLYGSLILSGANRYLNFGDATSTAGYGLRDNAGTIEFKNSGGSWSTFGAGSAFAYPFVVQTHFGTTTSATTTPLWARTGLFASSTSQFVQATTTLQTILGSLWLPSLVTGSLAVDQNGLVYKTATTTAGTGLSYDGTSFSTNDRYQIGTTTDITISGLAYYTKTAGLTTLGSAATGTISSANSALTVTANRYAVGGALTLTVATTSNNFFTGTPGQILAYTNLGWVGVATTSAGTGLTYTGTAFNVDFSQVNVTNSKWATSTDTTAIYPAGALKVGIGTTTPYATFAVQGTAGTAPIFQVASSSFGTVFLSVAGNSGITTIENASTTNLSTTYASSTRLVTGNLTLATLSGFLKATAGVVASATIDLVNDVGTSILAIANGGTGWANLQANTILLGNGTSRLATTSAGTNGQTLALVSGVPTWVSTTTAGTGLTYTGSAFTVDLGTSIDLTTEVTGDLPFANLTQIAANSVLGNITGSTGDVASIATSTLFGSTGTGGNVLMFSNGAWVQHATATCAAITGSSALCDGDDATGGGGGGAPSKWATTTGSYAIYPSGGATPGNVLLGIGTTTPRWALTVASSTGPQLALTDTSLTSNPWTFRSVGGNLYIATSSPTTFATSTSAFSIVNGGGIGLIGLGTGVPTTNLDINDSYPGGTPGILVRNTLAGTGNFAYAEARADETSGIRIVQTSSTYNTAVVGAIDPPNIAGMGTLISGRSGGMSIVASNGPIRFYSGDQSTIRAILNTSGNMGIGTTTPNWNLQVAGTQAYLALTSTNAAVDKKHVLLSNVDGIFRIGTSTDALSSTSTALSLDPIGPPIFGIGTTSPWRTLSVVGTASFVGLTTNTGGVSAALCLDSNNQVTVNTDNETCVASAGAYKTNVNTIVPGNALNLINQFRPVTFEYINQPGLIRSGFIAEEVELFAPQFVSHKTGGAVQGVRYIDMVPLLVQGLQETSFLLKKSVSTSTDGGNVIVATSTTPSFFSFASTTNLTALTAGFGATGTSTFSSTGILGLVSSTSLITSATGTLGFDTDAWALGRGAIQTRDGTANTYLIGALVSDAPGNGQVPKWNTGGTITWEDDLMSTSFAYPFLTAIHFGTSTSATTTPLFARTGLFASSTSQFDQATTTQLTVSGASWFTSFATGALAADNLGKLYQFATSTLSTISGTLDLATQVGTSILAIANGGTGWANLQANTILLGNGTSRLATTSAGTNGQTLALVSGVPTWVSTTTAGTGLTYTGSAFTVDLGTSIDLTTEVTGDLPFANLTQIAANSVLGNITGSTGDVAAISTSSLYAGTAGQVLARVGSTWVGVATTSAGTGLTYDGTSFNANCVAITGSASLCDGDDASGGGGGASTDKFATSTTDSLSIYANSAHRMGIGTTTPRWSLHIASSTGPQFALSDGSLTADHWTMRTINGNFYFATSSATTFATTSVPALTILSSGEVGIATSSPYATFSVHADSSFGTGFSVGNTSNTYLSVANSGFGTTTVSGLNIAGTATTTSNVGFNITSGCYAINGACIGYTVKLSYIFATSTPGADVAVTRGSTGNGPTFTLGAPGTLTLPANTSYYVVELWGGGGGGGATSTSANNSVGQNGGDSCFGHNATACTTPLVSAGGGVAPANGQVATVKGGAGGIATVTNGGSYAFGINGGVAGGGIGDEGSTGMGGHSPRGGAGAMATSSTGRTGENGYGPGGGGGGGRGSATALAAGGGGGAYTQIISTSTATRYYTVGAGGLGGRANTGGGVCTNVTGCGGKGASGGLVVTVYATSSANSQGNDYAEMFPVSNPLIQAGDIVAVDAGIPVSMKLATRGDVALAGVISTEPGHVLGDPEDVSMRPVALSGRVVVKFSDENGPVKIGDRVAVSSTAGIGRKANLYDDSVGIVIDAVKTNDGGVQTVMIFLDLRKGFDMNELAMAILGADQSSASSTPQAGPFDFVGGVMDAIGSRIGPVLGAISSEASASSSPPSDASAVNFLKNLFARITEWLADAGNGIGDFFANRVRTHELCVADESGEETCITKSQLDALLASAVASAPAPADPPAGDSLSDEESPVVSDVEPPVITIHGNNPAEIAVDTFYADLGATVTDNVDQNLGITTTVDGVETVTVNIDTSAPGEHTILYRATDQAGNTSEAARTVIVSDPAPEVEPSISSEPEPVPEPAPTP